MFTGEAWKTMCVECFRKSKNEEKDAKNPIEKVYSKEFDDGFKAGLRAARVRL
jgi:hypothetical protein